MRRDRALASPVALLCLALCASTSCSRAESEDPTPAAARDASAPAEGTESSTERTSPPSPTPTEPEGIGTMIAAGMDAVASPAERLTRGDALGHFVFPAPSALLSDIRTRAAPAEGSALLDETVLRNMARLTLGSRSGLADHVSLDGPVGCVLFDHAAADTPIACTVAFEGGAAAAVSDLGPDGKLDDPSGHVAHYRVEGQDLYLDQLDEQLVVTNHPAVFGEAEAYLRRLLGRAPTIGDDLELVLYPSASITRYSQQVDTLLSVLRSAPGPDTGNPLADAFTDYSRASLDRTVDYYREIDQIHLGVGLEPRGLVLRYAVFPTAGSRTQSDTQAIASGPVDPDLVRRMPAESWMISASTIDWKAAWGLESAVPLRDMMIEAYAGATDRDAADVRRSVEAFLDENAGLYDDDMALALVHLPGTPGGLVLGRTLDAPARERWTPWTERFTPEAVLGPEAGEALTWSFQADAMVVDGVAVDRWTLEPGTRTMAALARDPDPILAELERRLGGFVLDIDRVELSDRVLFVVAPGHQEQYVRAAIEATRSGGSGADPGLSALLARNPDTSAMAAFDVAGALAWAREVLPADVTGSLPATLGKDLGDVYFSATYGASGQQHGEIVLSQSMIDQLRALRK